MPFLLHEALIYMIFKEDENGQKGIANTIEILRKMWCEIGEEALKEWIQRTFILVQSEEILLPEMCESENTIEDTNEQVMVKGDCEKNDAEEGLCNMWCNGEIGDTPQRREPNEQLAQELDLLMQKLSFEDAQTEVIMYCLRIACEGEVSVFEALPTVSEGENIGVYDRDGKTIAYSIENHPAVRRVNIDESGKVQTLTSRMGTGGGNVPMVMVEGVDCYNQQMTGNKAKCLTHGAADTDHIPCVVMDRSAFNQGVNAKFNIGIDENGVAFSCIAKGPGAVCYIDTSHADDVVRTDDVVAPLQARDYNGGKLIAMATQQGGAEIRDDDKCPTLTAAAGMSGNNQPVICYRKPHYIVRRLTPLECERLQGFPDGWTDIGEYTDSKGKKKKTSDSARYKALGNSIALPQWKWVIKRLCSHYERDATMASLFDGIGGFPHLWEQINGKGTALWASEVEDFPIAVTKARIE